MMRWIILAVLIFCLLGCASYRQISVRMNDVTVDIVEQASMPFVPGEWASNVSVMRGDDGLTTATITDTKGKSTIESLGTAAIGAVAGAALLGGAP